MTSRSSSPKGCFSKILRTSSAGGIALAENQIATLLEEGPCRSATSSLNSSLRCSLPVSKVRRPELQDLPILS